MSLAQELQARGFINQTTAANLSELLDGPPRVVYHGVDPSADSIHAGNFAVFMLLAHLAQHGHQVILLIGGGTGMIGDPKPDVERPLTPPEEVAARAKKLRTQAEQLLATRNITIVNNYDWLGELKLIEFLRDIGKHFTVNELIKKEAIAERLRGEHGISYTEFAYPLLQGYDYLQLHQEHGCELQVGGSDQWGNILAGVELVRRKAGASVHALTIPLIVDKATGKKFGKSEGNAVWLDPEKTSPFQFYQFWLQVSDESVIEYLKLFTFLSLEEISSLAESHLKQPEERTAQRTLAQAVTTIVHGTEAANAAVAVSEILFGTGDVRELPTSELQMLCENAPTHRVVMGTVVRDVLVTSGLARSNREARTFLTDGAVSLNGERVNDLEATVSAQDMQAGWAVLKRGKKQLVILLPAASQIQR